MEIKKLTEICNPKQWKTIPTSELIEIGYPVYGANGIIGFYNEYNHDNETIAITCRGATCGTVNLTCPKAYITGNAMCLDDINDTVLLEYLFYAMKAYDFSKIISGSAQPQITRQGLEKVEVVIHPKQKQKQIVLELQNVDSLITARHEQLARLDELVKSRFIEMFGNPITNSKCLPINNLGKVLLLKAGDFTAASDIAAEPTTENIYPCYGGNGIRGYVAEYNQEGSYSLIGRQGALSGNVQYAKGKFKNTEHALLATPLIEMNSIWLNHLLINLDLQRYQTGAAQPGLSVKNLQEIPIIEVPKEDQNQFAAFVEQIDKSKFEIQKSLEKLETLKKALMQKYFG